MKCYRVITIYVVHGLFKHRRCRRNVKGGRYCFQHTKGRRTKRRGR